MAKAYTLATYHVSPGREDEFVRRWNELAATFSSLPDPPYWGALIRSLAEPTLFCSFGPWEEARHVEAMRASPDAGEAFRQLHELCTELVAGDYELVTRVEVRPEPAA